MKAVSLESEVVDRAVRDRNAARLRDLDIVLPTFRQLAEPRTIPAPTLERLAAIDPDEPHRLNLFRVHWYNDRARRALGEVPDHVVLPSSLTGVDATIVVLLGNRFPMIRAHKVLAAYACLAPRIVTGQFDLTRHRAVWPSTGNFCRGGVAMARILGCRGVAVLPAGMSLERFEWLERWVSDASDIVRTPGTESNVKEIYDACAALARDARNVVFNQFAEFGNYLVHCACTGSAVARVMETFEGASLHSFVAASGSGGTLGAGDALKERFGSLTVAVEPLECSTLIDNAFGEHNIQGIGDKHVPLIHNVMNTDAVVAVSDRSTDALNVLFSTGAGLEFLAERHKVPEGVIAQLSSFGLSSLCNVIAAIKVAKYYALGPTDVVATVATDGAEMYASEVEKTLARRSEAPFDAVDAAEIFGEHLAGIATDHVAELSTRDRNRMFNLGYYTWVEQQGYSIAEFEERRSQDFWRGLRQCVPAWDEMIREVNAEASCPA